MRAGTAALVLSLLCGGVLVVANVIHLPDWVLVCALAGFALGLLLAVANSYRVARRCDVSVGSALWGSIRLGFRWIWEFLL